MLEIRQKEKLDLVALEILKGENWNKLRPKRYGMKFVDEDASIKRAKGISRSIVQNMSHQDYRHAYESLTESSVNMTILRSKQHTIHIITFRKQALNIWEDKRCWINKNESLPHDYFKSPEHLHKIRSRFVPSSGFLKISCSQS